MRGSIRAASLAGAVLLAGCGGNPDRASPVVTLPPAKPAAYAGPVLAPDGTCTGPAPTGATAIAPGIGECELVRLKGSAPTDVLVGESGRGQREVQVLYAEPGGKELYFFVNNRLDRIVK
ncbi:hypothetical protein [Methylobacterium nodulans]|uniref:Lipoprotein n=1 Tax=Methylobacterium nodulans (strain LMG 21967 / CNCM I-2342 / ORS 2060) TaxID=460265 RepID=B8IP86_METNO|nr:hypothetical protein [Methylobacterium nodulans]ACL60404.1 conserved hypothetical protein [Methylobacterium nodulans ORS 2060]